MTENEFESALKDGATELKRLSAKGVDLSGLALRGLLIEGCNMSDTVLVSTEFHRVTFLHTTMYGSRAENARLIECRSFQQSWAKATLVGCSFIGCHLDDASFEQTTLKDCVFENCELVAALFADEVPVGVSFNACRFEGGGFENGTGCTFVGCTFADVTFEFMNFSGTSFEKCVFQNCVLVESDFTGANFCGADLREMRFELEDAEPPDLSGAKFDAITRFPEGFDPEERGMVKVD